MNLQKYNKKAQFTSVLIAVITIFIVAIILFFMNHVNEKLYGALEDNFEDNPKLNNTEADIALDKIHDIEESNIWDWVFLAIFIGLMIQMLIFSFASRTNVAFFWIFVLLGIIILIVGVVLSNTWQKLAENGEFAETILRFPVTNAILGNGYPMIVVGIIFLTMIVLFGKFPGQQTP